MSQGQLLGSFLYYYEKNIKKNYIYLKIRLTNVAKYGKMNYNWGRSGIWVKKPKILPKKQMIWRLLYGEEKHARVRKDHCAF
jgi:hypothetical protein